MTFENCVSELENDGVCVLPSETVYGLAGSAISEKAVKKIFHLKGRPPNNPLIVHVLNHESAKDFCHTNRLSELLAASYWPGPLTLILPKKNSIPTSVSAGLGSIAIRSPAHPLFREVLKNVGFPLAAPSANPSNKLSPTQANDVIESFGDSCPVVLDGGACSYGIESTVLDLTTKPPVILREGPVSKLEIEEKIGQKINSFKESLATISKEANPLKSPGQMSKHYAPNTPVRLFSNLDKLFRFKFDKDSDIILLSHSNIRVPKLLENFSILYFSKNGEWKDVAKNLYKVLREADRLGKKQINLCLFRNLNDEFSAINDRLTRACTISI